ncbi:DUF1450 domain-containing protein [Terrisporobacter sp.]
MPNSIRICDKCSNINIEKLKEKFGDENIKVGCVGACRETKSGYFGKINGVYVSEDNEEEFIKKCEI